MVEVLPDQWLHSRLLLWLLYPLLRVQTHNHGILEHSALLRIHSHYGLCVFSAHRYAQGTIFTLLYKFTGLFYVLNTVKMGNLAIEKLFNFCWGTKFFSQNSEGT